jgi:hypothetical protein
MMSASIGFESSARTIEARLTKTANANESRRIMVYLEVRGRVIQSFSEAIT